MPSRDDFDDLVCAEPPAESLLPRPIDEMVSGPTIRLHMEARYILDCAVELGEITPMESQVFLTNTPPAVAYSELSERDELTPPHWFRNTARAYLDNLPREEQYVWALRAMEGFQFGVQALRGRMEFMVQSKVQSDLGVAPRGAIAWMDEGTSGIFGTLDFDSVHAVTQEKVHLFLTQQYGEAKARLEADIHLLQEALMWVQAPGNKERARQLAKSAFTTVELVDRVGALEPMKSRQQLKVQRQRTRTARSAIKKAMKLFSRAGFEDSVRLLVHGQEVEISNPESPFKFVLQPFDAGWLENRTLSPGGHTPYQMTLLTKDDVFISRLCVLFDQTPVLDQLLALTLFVRSGDELELLKKANWFGYESSESVCAILADTEPRLLERFKKENRTSNLLSASLQEHHRIEQHWEPYKGPVTNWIASWMAGIQEGITSLGLNCAPAALA